MNKNLLKSVLKPIIPKKIRKGVRDKLVNASTEAVVPMKVKTRNYLNQFFKEDVDKLSELINKDLTHWTT